MYLSIGSPEVVQAVQALELATRDHLKSLRDSNFHWLLGCTFAVGVGLLMELPEIVHDMCEIYGRTSRELKYWLTPSINRGEYPRRDWVKKWSALGWILIVLGVMGEGWFEAQVSKYDSALSNITDTVVAEAQKESAHAEATAKGFDARIAESDAKAKSAEATAKKFESQIAEAQRDAAESKKQAEAEQLERVKLQKQIQPRTVSESDRKKLGDVLRQFAASLKGRKVKISSQTGDAENMVLSLEIMDILTRAGIEVDPAGMGRLMPIGGVFMGVNVTGPVSDGKFIESLAKGLASRADTAVGGEWNPKYTEVGIMVGAKPVVGLEQAKDLPHP
jgi:hypothetical protein